MSGGAFHRVRKFWTTWKSSLPVCVHPCSVKHGLIIKTWVELPVGDYFILLNDHDPVPLYHQLAAEYGEAVRWEHLERGPGDFRIKISKVKALGSGSPESISHCCGH
jgi:uncharacterized protein (DUF2249 family)